MAASPISSLTDLTLDEYRSLAIFTSYLLLNLTLTLFLTSTIISRFTALPRAHIPTLRVALFALLALASLAATWHHMLAFFTHSFRAHLALTQPAVVAHDPLAALPPLARFLRLLGVESLPEQRLKAALKASVNGLPLEPKLVAAWLNQSSLFREAWEAACATPVRYFWTQQIFGLTAAWAVYLGWSSRRAAVAYAPLFMVLAQLVAVSFAMNLFFVAVLLTPTVTDNTTEDKSRLVRRGRHAATWYAVVVTFISIPLLPATVGTQYFPLVLAVPHLLLFMPSLGIRGDPNEVWNLYRFAYLGILAIQAVSAVYIAFGHPATMWLSATTTELAHEFYAQTRLIRALFPLDLFLKQPWSVQLRTLLEPFMAPSTTLLNVMEPQLSVLVAWIISSVSIMARQFMEDPLILLTWLVDISSFIRSKNALLEEALFAHPAVTSVGLDAVLVYISGLLWIWTGEGAWKALIGGP